MPLSVSQPQPMPPALSTHPSIHRALKSSGTFGGGWSKVSPSMRALKEHVIPPSTPNYNTFNPHGIDVDEANDRVVTGDYISVASTLLLPNGSVQPLMCAGTTTIFHIFNVYASLRPPC